MLWSFWVCIQMFLTFWETGLVSCLAAAVRTLWIIQQPSTSFRVMPKRKRGLLKQPCNSSRVSSPTAVAKPRDEEEGVCIWVQCENESCQKWRQISTEEAKGLEDSAWYCWLNRDPRYNTCSAVEQKAKKPKHMKFIYSLLPLGEVVIAKLSGYPPWVLDWFSRHFYGI